MIWKPTWLLLVFRPSNRCSRRCWPSGLDSWTEATELAVRVAGWSGGSASERVKERRRERESARSANRKCRPRPPASRLMLSLVQKWNPNSVLRIWNDPNQNGMQCCRCYWAYLSLLQPEIMDGRPEEEEALLTTTDGNRHCTDPSNKLIKSRMSRSIQPLEQYKKRRG